MGTDEIYQNDPPVTDFIKFMIACGGKSMYNWITILEK